MSDDLEARINAEIDRRAAANKPASAPAPQPAPQPTTADRLMKMMEMEMTARLAERMEKYAPPPGSPNGPPPTYDESDPTSLIRLDKAGVEALMKAGKLRQAGDKLSDALGGRGLFRRSSDR